MQIKEGIYFMDGRDIFLFLLVVLEALCFSSTYYFVPDIFFSSPSFCVCFCGFLEDQVTSGDFNFQQKKTSSRDFNILLEF